MVPTWPAKKQAAKWSNSIALSAGVFVRQVSLAYKQRGWKLQPGGGSIGLGTSPFKIMRAILLREGSGMGTADKSAWV